MLTGSLSPSSAGRFVAGAPAAAFFGGSSVLRTLPFAIILRGSSVTSMPSASSVSDSSLISGVISLPDRASVPAVTL